MTAASAPASTGAAEQLRASLRRAGPIAVAGVVANGANVAVTVVIAHLMSTRAYGSLTELIALFVGLSMPGSALLVAVVRRVAAWELAGAHDRVGPWIMRVRRRGALALIGWSVIAIAIRQPLADALHLPHADGVAEVLIAGGGWALLSIERGLVQAGHDYRALARNLVVEGGVRTLLTVALVGAGLGIEGAAIALVVAMAASIADARRSVAAGARLPAAASDASDASDAFGDGALPGRRHLTLDLATALAALGLLAILQNMDVIAVGRQAPDRVGAYGAISVACKAVVFGATVLSGYLLPEAVARFNRGGHALRQLAAALGLAAVPVAVLVALATGAPRLLLRVAFGPDKVGAAPAFATLALAMAGLAVSVLCTHYLLGIGRRAVVAVLAVAAAVLGVVLAAAGGHPIDTARAELALQGGLAVVLGAMVISARPVPRSAVLDPVA
ncbi:MAG: hypothetical protein JWO37_1408 [Acidimicrobiales bacterium]|nr:hypothetical protein [Acidimicrobiales bacterium]